LAPPALPGFIATMTLSETQASRRPIDDVGVASTGSGLPPITQIAFSTCRAHYPGGSIWYVSIGYGAVPRWDSQIALAFPERRAGRHPQLSFRGLLELYSRYGLRSCSPTYSGLCHEASYPDSYPSRPLVSYPGISTELLGWDSHPLVIRAVGALLRFVLFVPRVIRGRSGDRFAPGWRDNDRALRNRFRYLFL